MAIDYIVGFVCDPKLQHGNGDPAVGTQEIMEFVKAKNRAEMAEGLAHREGKALSELKINLGLITESGVTEQREVSYDQLREMAAPLEGLSTQCESCPSNILNGPAGCYGAINYPIAERIETWVASRLQPASTFGGQLCLDFMKEFRCNGAQTAEMRKRGFFARKNTVTATLKNGFFKKAQVTTDQVFDAMFAVGSPLQPAHSLGVLVWLNCLRVEGQALGGPNERELLGGLAQYRDPESKGDHVAFDAGSRNLEDPVVQIQDFLHAMYVSWRDDTPLFVSP